MFLTAGPDMLGDRIMPALAPVMLPPLHHYIP